MDGALHFGVLLFLNLYLFCGIIEVWIILVIKTKRASKRVMH